MLNLAELIGGCEQASPLSEATGPEIAKMWSECFEHRPASFRALKTEVALCGMIEGIWASTGMYTAQPLGEVPVTVTACLPLCVSACASSWMLLSAPHWLVPTGCLLLIVTVYLAQSVIVFLSLLAIYFAFNSLWLHVATASHCASSPASGCLLLTCSCSKITGARISTGMSLYL